MKSRKNDSYLEYGVTLLNKLRSNATEYYNNLVDRVIFEFNDSATKKRVADLNNLNERKKSSSSSSFSNFKNFLLSLPDYYSAVKKLKRLRLANHGEKIVVIALFGKRMKKQGSEFNLNNYLSTISKGFYHSKERLKICGLIRAAPLTVIYDPSFISPLRGDENEKDILIIDQGFLVYQMIIRPHYLISIFFSAIFKKSSLSKYQILVSRFFEKTFSLVLDKFNISNGIFFTANTFSVEILRYYLLHSDKCDKVYEVMHGVPSIYVQNYFKGLVDLERLFSSKKNKMNFITQIPLIQDVILDEYNSRVDKCISINSYYNSYAFNNKLNSIDNIETLLSTKMEQIFELSNKKVNEAFVLFYIGAGTVTSRENFATSNSFMAESLILGNIASILEDSGEDFLIAYAPHPDSEVEELKHQEIFQSEKIVFIEDTLSSLFLADACVGFLSSVLFEARYLKLPVFSPMMLADKLFSEELLNLINYPNVNEHTQESMARFIQTAVKGWSSDKLARGKQRVDLILTERAEHDSV